MLTRRGWLGVSACALGVALLLWHEFTHLAGRPGYVALALFAAATWALGTQLLRNTRIELPTLTLSFWMTALTAVVMTAADRCSSSAPNGSGPAARPGSRSPTTRC